MRNKNMNQKNFPKLLYYQEQNFNLGEIEKIPLLEAYEKQ